MAEVRFEYRLSGRGWGRGRLQVGSASVDLTASYLEDALGDLVRGALALARGATEVRVAWAQETCDPEAFWSAIAYGARAVRDELGLDGYKQAWAAHDFPTERLDDLLALSD